MTTVLFTVTAVVVARSARVAQLDEDVLASLSALRGPRLDPVMQFITDLGSNGPFALMSLVLAFVLACRTRRLVEPLVFLAMIEASLSLVQVIKGISDRARPPIGGMLGEPVFDFSFPSGHTASGTVVYVLGAVLLTHNHAPTAVRRVLVAGGCLLAALMGLSRVYLGYHWFTDVVGGWLLAAVLTCLGIAFVALNPRPAVVPIVGDVAAAGHTLDRTSRPVVGVLGS